MAEESHSLIAAPVQDISNLIALFSEAQVERLTGLSTARLRSWARAGFFKPNSVEDATGRTVNRFYTFKGVVALRTLGLLQVKERVPLRHLREVAERLHHQKDELWTVTTLYIVKQEVVFDTPETGRPQELFLGQAVPAIALATIIADISAAIVELTKRRVETIGKIAQHRTILRNAWVVDGTRIPVAALQRLHEDGYSVAGIIEEYPDLTAADVAAALAHAEPRAA
jgi:hypothetical protein